MDEQEINAQKWRDLLKSAIIKSTDNALYLLLGVENQTNIHYAMPVKSMLYDALNYGRQVNEASKLHQINKDKLSSDEFLSGFKKTDKLTPIIPVTLYWGTEPWDAPTHLHDMFQDIDENLLQFIPDYHINLVEPSSITDFEKFHTELGKTLEFIKYSNNVPYFKKMLSNLKGKKLKNETISTINLFTGANIQTDEEGEVTDVCYAIEVLKKEAVAEELINSVDNTMKNFKVSLEKACNGLGHTVNDYYNAKELLEKAKKEAENVD